MELFQEKVLNKVPFFASHYEGHAAAAALERPAHGEDGVKAEEPPFARVRGNGNGNSGEHH
jgi:hypothetical protein